MGIKKIKSFHEELIEALGTTEGDVTLDMKNIDSIDLSFIQVIITAGRFMRQKGKLMKLQSVSQKVRDQLKLAGLR